MGTPFGVCLNRYPFIYTTAHQTLGAFPSLENELYLRVIRQIGPCISTANTHMTNAWQVGSHENTLMLIEPVTNLALSVCNDEQIGCLQNVW